MGARLDFPGRQPTKGKEHDCLEHQAGHRVEVRRCPLLDVVLDERRGQRTQRKEQRLDPRRVDHGQHHPGRDRPAKPRPAARRHPGRGRAPGIEPFTDRKQAGDDDAHEEAGMQVGPQPDEGWQQPGTEAAPPIGAQPDHEQASEQHVEQLGTGAPGRGTRQRAD